MILLPAMDECGWYKYPDGCLIYRVPSIRSKWAARWADGTPLRGDNDETSAFDTAEEAAQALADGSEGPWSMIENQLVVPSEEQPNATAFKELLEGCKNSLTALLHVWTHASNKRSFNLEYVEEHMQALSDAITKADLFMKEHR